MLSSSQTYLNSKNNKKNWHLYCFLINNHIIYFLLINVRRSRKIEIRNWRVIKWRAFHALNLQILGSLLHLFMISSFLSMFSPLLTETERFPISNCSFTVIIGYFCSMYVPFWLSLSWMYKDDSLILKMAWSLSTSSSCMQKLQFLDLPKVNACPSSPLKIKYSVCSREFRSE